MDIDVNHSEKSTIDLTPTVTEKPKKQTEKVFKCNNCDVVFKNEKGLKIHNGKAHKSALIETPEKERSASFVEETNLTQTPIKGSIREEEEVLFTPAKIVDCKDNAVKEDGQLQQEVVHKCSEEIKGCGDPLIKFRYCNTCRKAGWKNPA